MEYRSNRRRPEAIRKNDVRRIWNQVWSFSGNTQRADVSQMFLQPFFAYQATRPSR